MAYIDAGTVRFYYEDAGAGEPVVFIHGSFSRGDSAFAAQLPVFSQSHRVLCPDLRGHGRTTAPSLDWNTPQLADDIVRFLDALHIPKAHIVGHSMGGDVVMFCAVRHPGRVATATSIASTGVASEAVRKYVREFHPENLRGERHKRFIERIRSDHAPAHKGDWQRFIAETIKSCERYPDFTDAELADISMPFLLLYGDDDPLIGSEEVARLESTIQNFTAQAVKGADHYLHMLNRHGHTVNKVLSGFFAANTCL